MGRNKKHQKDLRVEKSKTKLKTKFLPKGGNVTDVNFKIKPIVLREQLKSNSSDQLLTRKKQNMKDLLTRLNHYNTTMRFEACEGMIELINSSPNESIEQHLYFILQGVCKLVLDIETKVRQKAIKVLHAILEKVSSFIVAPFFNTLTSYVSCAMTHIDKRIQEDSLLVIDAYTEHVPDLILKNFDKLFGNFLMLISKLRNDSKLSRTLTVSLHSKLTSIKWRIKVLSRIHAILNIVVTQKKNVSFCSTGAGNCPVIKGEEVFYIPLYRNIRTSHDSTPALENESNINYMKVLLPLLYETWAEAVPLDEIKYRENGTMLIDQDAASILSCVVGILHDLLNFYKNSTSTNENIAVDQLLPKESKLLKHFLDQFPYRQHERRRKLEKDISKLLITNSDPRCVEENLLICYIFCSVYKDYPNNYYLKKAHETAAYINICLSNRNYIPSNAIKTITSLLRIIFIENLNTSQYNNIVSTKMLDNIVNFHNNLPINSEHRIEVFILLTEIAKEPAITGSEKYFTWLSGLPLLLLKPEISVNYVDTLSLLARQNNRIFLDALLTNFESLLDNLPKIRVINDGLPAAQIKLICMLYYIPKLYPKDINLVETFVKNNQEWLFVKHMELFLSKRRY